MTLSEGFFSHQKHFSFPKKKKNSHWIQYLFEKYIFFQTSPSDPWRAVLLILNGLQSVHALVSKQRLTETTAFRTGRIAQNQKNWGPKIMEMIFQPYRATS